MVLVLTVQVSILEVGVAHAHEVVQAQGCLHHNNGCVRDEAEGGEQAAEPVGKNVVSHGTDGS